MSAVNNKSIATLYSNTVNEYNFFSTLSITCNPFHAEANEASCTLDLPVWIAGIKLLGHTSSVAVLLHGSIAGRHVAIAGAQAAVAIPDCAAAVAIPDCAAAAAAGQGPIIVSRTRRAPLVHACAGPTVASVGSFRCCSWKPVLQVGKEICQLQLTKCTFDLHRK